MDLDEEMIARHTEQMRFAIAIAESCSNIEWYGVGCSIVNLAHGVISSGYTGEMLEAGKMRHAEDVAIHKALTAQYELSDEGIVLYSTLEPCSIRSSGKTPCCTRIIEAGIKKVVYGAKEPYDAALGIVCEGDAVLRSAGIEVTHLKSMQEECLKSAISKRRR